MPSLRILADPLALGLLGVSLAGAAWVHTVEPWSGRALWVVGWGFVIYAAAVAARLVFRPQKTTPIASEDVARLVSQALRDLDKTGRLAQSELIAVLPRSLAATRPSPSTANGPPTPEEQAHALAKVLNTAIDRLNEAGRPTEKRQDIHYKILDEEYRRGLSPTQIMVRLEVTDATFFRWRNEAVAAVARELLAREDRLRLRGAENPTAMDYLA
jgi:hypothetical protein